ncbi:hypothetical protein [Hymenobacter sp.]|jgi:hypothetical protein|uniref:hypothetical protein n=1 Tax=Hymenobacter sp. TaxID=1898978 RepID=UPI002ED9ACE1
MKTSLIHCVCTAALLAWTTLAAQAQKLPVPGEKNPGWLLQKTEEVRLLGEAENQPTPAPMPTAPRSGYYGGTKNQDGEWEILYDTKRGVRNNLKAYKQGLVRVQNLTTGTVYTYRRIASSSAH